MPQGTEGSNPSLSATMFFNENNQTNINVQSPAKAGLFAILNPDTARSDVHLCTSKYTPTG